MTVNSGVTSFGVIRKRMADLYVDFAARLKQNGAFGTLTTVDDPDTFAGDPLVAIAAASSASSSELWEATEFFYNQLDPDQAEGVYLERFHAERLGLTRAPDELDPSLRTRIKNTVRSAGNRTGAIATALTDGNVLDAFNIRATVNNTPEGMNAGESMLVVRGEPADPDAFVQSLYNSIDLPPFSFVGDVQGQATTLNGGCLSMNYQPACRIFIEILIVGYFIDEDCDPLDATAIMQQVIDRLKAAYSAFSYGDYISGKRLMSLVGKTNGYVISQIGLRRRAKELCLLPCDPGTYASTSVTIDGNSVEWIKNEVCTFCSGEVWSDTWETCLQLKPWEFPDFDLNFTAMVEDIQRDDCRAINIDDACPTCLQAEDCRVFLGLRIEYELKDGCPAIGQRDLIKDVVRRLKYLFTHCRAGSSFCDTDLMKLLNDNKYYEITALRMQRRPRLLNAGPCDPLQRPIVPHPTLGYENWWSNDCTEHCTPEIWCPIDLKCITFAGNEIVDFDEQFVFIGGIA